MTAALAGIPPEPDAACWCGSPRFQEQFRTRAFGLLRCLFCGSYRIDPPPITDDQQAPSFYTDYYGRRAGGQPPREPRTSRFWRVVDEVASLDHPGLRAADIGCGEGHLCDELRTAGWTRVIGIDVSRARIERARELYPRGEFDDRPLDQIGAAESSFDLMVMDNVIEHVPAPLSMVRTLARYLAPEGRLVLITPNMTSGHFRLLGRRWTPELAPHAHIYLFTPASIRQLLTRAGLAVEAVGSFHLPVYPVSQLADRLLDRDVKGAVWRLVQELGGLYGRLIGMGPMLYAVASPSPEPNGRWWAA